MENYPSNSRQPVTPEQPKQVRRVVSGEVITRKTPFGKRLTQNLLGGDVQSVWGWLFGELLIPAARDTLVDAISGGAERMIFGESHHGSRRSSRYRTGSTGNYTPYNQMSKGGRRDEPRREMSRRGRANHDFREIIIPSRAEAEEVLDRLEMFCDKYDAASVSDLYGMVGIPSNYMDEKFGWTDLRGARISRAHRGGYLLDLPRPEPID